MQHEDKKLKMILDFVTTEIENILTIAKNKAWEFYNQQIIKLNQERLSEFKNNGILPRKNEALENPITGIETKFLEMIAVQMDDILLLKTGKDKTKCRSSFIVSCINKLIENGDVDGYLSIMREFFNDNDDIKEILRIIRTFKFYKFTKIRGIF
jgi:hypothetical protein